MTFGEQTPPPASASETVAHTLSDGSQVSLPPHDAFYERLTSRNRGLITQLDQERLRRATILVAGCGSIGGAVIEPFVRLGAERLVLAEPDEYDLPNLNRQSARLQDIGRNKAEVFQDRMRDINPYASITVHPHGITDENVEELVRPATLIIDGVDVTTKPPLRMKYALHEQAKRLRVPVLAGYDVAFLQMLVVYDYRDPGTRLLHGRVSGAEIDAMDPTTFLRRMIPIAALPYEMIPELRRRFRGASGEGFPQVVPTANLFAVLALPAALALLAGRRVRRRVIVDVPTQLRGPAARLRVLLKRLYGLYRLNKEVESSRRSATGTATEEQPRRPS